MIRDQVFPITHTAGDRNALAAAVALAAREDAHLAVLEVDHARQSGADLVVAGGYGQSRVREWLLGGVTRELLLTTPVPVLSSH